MNAKSTMQMLNLGLSIFNKVQTMQHRQIRMANDIAKSRLPRVRPTIQPTTMPVQDAQIVDDSHI